MKFINDIERINKVHNLILNEKTGTPNEFAKKVNVSRSQIYNLISFINDIGGLTKYSRKRETFYYENSFDFQLVYTLKINSEKGAISKD